MALITTMLFLGAIYGLLGVHFIAAFQVLIYVGAVMVFMVYVIMLLEVRESVAERVDSLSMRVTSLASRAHSSAYERASSTFGSSWPKRSRLRSIRAAKRIRPAAR